MSWLQHFSQINVQQILDQVSQGIITPQEAAPQLQGLDVCGMISSAVDSYGYLEILSRILQCPSILEGMNPTEEQQEPLEEEIL